MTMRHLLLPFLSALCVAADAAAPTPAPGAAGTTPAVATPVAPAEKPFLGLRFDESAPNFATEPGLPVADLVPGATGQQLGLEVGDRILSINGRKTKTMADLQSVLGSSKVGDNVTIAFLRHGGEQVVTGPLAAKPKPINTSVEVAKAQKALDEVKALAEAKAREPSLVEIMQQLKAIEDGLPRAVAAFKKQYPNGTFDIRISVTICNDATAKDPIEITNTPKTEAGKPATAGDDKAAKPDAPKPAPATPK